MTSEPTEIDRARRTPRQARSRRRVAQLLDAASELVLDEGVEAVTTRSISQRAGMPVASLYQYFADRDEVLMALVRRDVAEMDEQLTRDLGKVADLSMENVVRTTMSAYVTSYRRRPAFVEIYLRGRTNAAIAAFCREHNREVAHGLWAFGRETGLIDEGVDPAYVRLAVEVGDKAFQVAFEDEITGDPALLDEAIALVTGYLARFAVRPAEDSAQAPDEVPD